MGHGRAALASRFIFIPRGAVKSLELSNLGPVAKDKNSGAKLRKTFFCRCQRALLGKIVAKFRVGGVGRPRGYLK
jgi:hypothetical protein